MELWLEDHDDEAEDLSQMPNSVTCPGRTASCSAVPSVPSAICACDCSTHSSRSRSRQSRP